MFYNVNFSIAVLYRLPITAVGKKLLLSRQLDHVVNNNYTNGI